MKMKLCQRVEVILFRPFSQPSSKSFGLNEVSLFHELFKLFGAVGIVAGIIVWIASIDCHKILFKGSTVLIHAHFAREDIMRLLRRTLLFIWQRLCQVRWRQSADIRLQDQAHDEAGQGRQQGHALQQSERVCKPAKKSSPN